MSYIKRNILVSKTFRVEKGQLGNFEFFHKYVTSTPNSPRIKTAQYLLRYFEAFKKNYGKSEESDLPKAGYISYLVARAVAQAEKKKLSQFHLEEQRECLIDFPPESLKKIKRIHYPDEYDDEHDRKEEQYIDWGSVIIDQPASATSSAAGLTDNNISSEIVDSATDKKPGIDSVRNEITAMNQVNTTKKITSTTNELWNIMENKKTAKESENNLAGVVSQETSQNKLTIRRESIISDKHNGIDEKINAKNSPKTSATENSTKTNFGENGNLQATATNSVAKKSEVSTCRSGVNGKKKKARMMTAAEIDALMKKCKRKDLKPAVKKRAREDLDEEIEESAPKRAHLDSEMAVASNTTNKRAREDDDDNNKSKSEERAFKRYKGAQEMKEIQPPAVIDRFHSKLARVRKMPAQRPVTGSPLQYSMPAYEDGEERVETDEECDFGFGPGYIDPQLL